jgi:hypothetical protein
MDLLVEKLDGSRYYLSQYKVLITEFEESAPSVTRNNMQLDQRNGNIDFGGWHTDKTINITGYYRADDMDEEEALREKLYALLSDPNGYYITQLKTSPSVAMERPGETSGGYYDKLTDYPSHKRFLVYTEAPDVELVGNVNGTLLYKLTAEFKTLKLPYGETPAINIDIDNMPHNDMQVNLLTGTGDHKVTGTGTNGNLSNEDADDFLTLFKGLEGQTVTLSVDYEYSGFITGSDRNRLGWEIQIVADTTTYPSVWYYPNNDSGSGTASATFVVPKNITRIGYVSGYIQFSGSGTGTLSHLKLEKGNAATNWSPNPADPEYPSWYYKKYGTISIPYSGTVPCNQLEQKFAIELIANGEASSLSFKIDDTEFTYSGGVASGDVVVITGFSYTKNGLSIVSNTNKAYFILQPDKPNRITCNVPGTIKIIGLQNLYA